MSSFYDNAAYSETVNGLTIKIVQDDYGDTESPIAEDEAVVMAVLHRRYMNPAVNSPAHLPIDSDGNYYDLESIEGIAQFESDMSGDDSPWAVFPLFMYDHSGTVYRASEGRNPFSCPWDSGRVGIIALDKSQVGKPEESGDYLEQANSICATYTAWANGQVYGFVIEDENGEELDSCWGFIEPEGAQGYVLEEARESLKRYLREHAKAATEARNNADYAECFAD